MKKNLALTISSFAKLSRTTHSALYHYDRIKLLSPHVRAQNGYRYYSSDQLAIMRLIQTSQRLGLTLEAIKDFTASMTPGKVDDLLKKQVLQIDKKIDEWVSSRNLAITIQKCIRSCQGVDENAVTVQDMPSEAIVLGNLNDYSKGRDTCAAMLSFYKDMGEKYPGLDLNYPVWASFSEDRIKNRDWHNPDRFYFYNPSGYDRKPAGLYVVGYTRGGYGQVDAAYSKCMAYIEKKKFEINGDTYEEYPLNELCINDPAQYLIRVLVPVRKKQSPVRHL